MPRFPLAACIVIPLLAGAAARAEEASAAAGPDDTVPATVTSPERGADGAAHTPARAADDAAPLADVAPVGDVAEAPDAASNTSSEGACPAPATGSTQARCHKCEGKKCEGKKCEGKKCEGNKCDGKKCEGNPSSRGKRCDKGSKCHAPRFPALRAGGFTVRPRLRLRTGYQYIQPDADVRFVGGNDGFFLEQGRLGLEASWRDTVTLRLIVDATSALPGGAPNDPVRPAVAAFRDAYIEWTPSPYFSLLAGQALLPFLAEGAVSRADMNFIARSVMADGVRAGQGFFEPGLSPDRELGITVGARRAPVGDAFVQYLLTLANGNGQNRLGNDNKLPALLGRLGGGVGRLVEGGVGVQYNPRTVGELPNLYDETDLEVAADLRVRVFGFDWLGQAAWRSTSFDTVFPREFFPEGDPAASDQAFGFTSWLVLSDPLGLPTFGFKPGYRFSYYDPRSSSAEDQLYEHTFGVRYDPPGGGPVALLLDATLLFEGGAAGEGTRQLDNHRVSAMLQFDL